jgi:hypothetical protein
LRAAYKTLPHILPHPRWEGWHLGSRKWLPFQQGQTSTSKEAPIKRRAFPPGLKPVPDSIGLIGLTRQALLRNLTNLPAIEFFTKL